MLPLIPRVSIYGIFTVIIIAMTDSNSIILYACNNRQSAFTCCTMWYKGSNNKDPLIVGQCMFMSALTVGFVRG